MEDFGKFCFAVLALLVLYFVGGYVFQTLWGWFIIPVFSAPALTIPQAIGIGVVGKYYTANHKRTKTKEFNETASDFGFSLVVSLVTLGVGWIITLFL